MKGKLAKIDTSGRVCIPKYIRRNHGFDIGDTVFVRPTTAGTIQLEKAFLNECIFCNNLTESTFGGYYVCEDCKDKIVKRRKEETDEG
jgi:bifunctional DNA-binding transcriptional regulator/antitoxin component of YhaV-PrlF toxin-antitoxin module